MSEKIKVFFKKAAVMFIFAALTGVFISRSFYTDAARAATAVTLRMATGSKEGTYYAIAHSMVQVLSKNGITLNVQESKGSLDNLKNLAEGNADLALVQLDVVGSLLAKGETADKIQLLLPMYSEQVHFVARKDASISSLNDLKGKKIQMGEEGSGTYVSAQAMLAAVKLNPKKDCTVLNDPPKEALRMLLGGQADAMFYVGGAPLPLFWKLPVTAVKQITLVSIPSQELSALEKTGFYHAASIAAKTYPWQKDKAATAGVWAAMLSGSKLGDNDARALLETIFKALPDLRRLHRRWDINKAALNEAKKIKGLKINAVFLQTAGKYLK